MLRNGVVRFGLPISGGLLVNYLWRVVTVPLPTDDVVLRVLFRIFFGTALGLAIGVIMWFFNGRTEIERR